MIDREDAKKQLPKGWHKLVDQIYDLATRYGGVELIKNKMSWLRANVKGLDGPGHIELIKLENESHVTCMHCGRYGKLVADYTVLCLDCNDLGVFLLHGKTTVPDIEP